MAKKKNKGSVIFIIVIVAAIFFLNTGRTGELPNREVDMSQPDQPVIKLITKDAQGNLLQSIIGNQVNVSLVSWQIYATNTGTEPITLKIKDWCIVGVQCINYNWVSHPAPPSTGLPDPASDWNYDWRTLYLEPGQTGYWDRGGDYDVKNHEDPNGGEMTVTVEIESRTLDNVALIKDYQETWLVYPDGEFFPDGSPTNFIVTPQPPPTPIIDSPVNSAHSGTVHISWHMPNSYSGDIVKYKIQYSDDGITWTDLTETTSTAYDWDVSGLSGQYAIRVKAHDGYNWGGYQMSGTPPDIDYSDVLVLYSTQASTSLEVAQYYMSQMNIPSDNLCQVTTTPSNMDRTAHENLMNDVNTCIATTPYDINYIVFTRGMTIAYGDGFSGNPNKLSVDATAMYFNEPSYYDDFYDRWSDGRPSYETNLDWYYEFVYYDTIPDIELNSNLYLYGRLDGWSVDEAKALVDRSKDSWGKSGLVVLDQHQSGVDPITSYSTYGGYEASLAAARDLAIERGYDVVMNDMSDAGQPNFLVTRQPAVAFYASWGSNDGSVIGPSYPFNTWVDGALVETAVSTSAAGVTDKPTNYAQSRIADVTAEGASGARGSVAEPYITGISRPHILFDMYTRGYDMGTAYATAAPKVLWEDLILGDPKMAPYKWSPFTIN